MMAEKVQLMYNLLPTLQTVQKAVKRRKSILLRYQASRLFVYITVYPSNKIRWINVDGTFAEKSLFYMEHRKIHVKEIDS